MRRRTSDFTARVLDMKRLNSQCLTLLLGNQNLASLTTTAHVYVSTHHETQLGSRTRLLLWCRLIRFSLADVLLCRRRKINSQL